LRAKIVMKKAKMLLGGTKILMGGIEDPYRKPKILMISGVLARGIVVGWVFGTTGGGGVVVMASPIVEM
jgi:hypothetical protein